MENKIIENCIFENFPQKSFMLQSRIIRIVINYRTEDEAQLTQYLLYICLKVYANIAKIIVNTINFGNFGNFGNF